MQFLYDAVIMLVQNNMQKVRTQKKTSESRDINENNIVAWLGERSVFYVG